MRYNIKLPHKFIFWYVIKIPLKILKIGRVLLATLDNEMSFLANIRLLFVPLFGIGTIIGRIISFFTRIFMIIFGAIIMTIMLITSVVLPFLWFSIPFLINHFLSLTYVVIYFIVIYILWTISNLNKPEKKVSQISSTDKQLLSFRPETRYQIKSGNKDANTILRNILNDKKIVYLLNKSELWSKAVLNKLSNSPGIKSENIVNESFNKARENKSRYVEIEHLFLAIIDNIPNIETVLSTFNSNLEIIKQTAFWIVEERERMAGVYMWQDDYVMPPLGGIGRGMLGRVTPNLDRASADITKQVKRGTVKNIVGREEEIKKIAEILDGEKNDILIIGESGIGKTSIIRGIAYKIMTGTEYKTLKNKRIVSLDVASLISGGENLGGLADKLVNVLEEVEASGDIVLFIDEIQNLVTGMGEEGGYDSTIFSML
ncbi:AAA family ATPase, partial [Patescibacteria group bacterium]|nr:AAA family ATPase [Patescibacteria group bacterium]